MIVIPVISQSGVRQTASSHWVSAKEAVGAISQFGNRVSVVENGGMGSGATSITPSARTHAAAQSKAALSQQVRLIVNPDRTALIPPANTRPVVILHLCDGQPTIP